jgi:hypothetical protein
MRFTCRCTGGDAGGFFRGAAGTSMGEDALRLLRVA